MILSEIFSRVVNMSLTASVVIVIVLLARLVLGRAPKVFSYALWAVVLFRLLCPVSIPSPVSLLKLVDPPVSQASPVVSRVEYIAPERVEAPVFPSVPETENIHREPSVSPAPIKKAVTLRDVLPYLWLTGMEGMLLYGLVSLLRFRKHLTGALPIGGNLYLVDHLDSAFVTGLVFPKIYLPSDLPEERMEYIVAHERHHIRRLDHIAKHLSFLALCVHWFNPLVWIAFLLSGRDMEMSCDEAVIRKLGSSIRADYSESLIDLATRRVTVAGSPLAFGEGDTKSRILNLLRWKEPRKIISLLCTVAAVVILAACAANPEKPVVVSKGDDAFRKNAAVSAEETHALDATQAVKYTDTFTSTDGSVAFQLSIDETLPASDMPVVEVRPHILTGEDAERIAKALYGNAVFRDIGHVFNPIYTKKEIQERLGLWTRYVSDEAALESLFGESDPLNAEILRTAIENNTPMLETAPEESPYSLTDWQFKNACYYYDTPEEIQQYGLRDDLEEICLLVNADGLEYRFDVSIRDRKDWKKASVYARPGNGIHPHEIDKRVFYMEHFRTDPPTQEQIQNAESKALSMLEKMELGQWQIISAYVEHPGEGTELDYVIRINATPVLGGVPAGVRQGNPADSDAYSFDYGDTEASFGFSANGVLSDFSLDAPIDEVREINSNVAVMDMDDLIVRAKEQFSLCDDRAFGAGPLIDALADREALNCFVSISGMAYRLLKVPIKDSDTTFAYAPCATLSGTVEYIGADTGNVYHSYSRDLLTLNAMDGSVIEFTPQNIPEGKS